MVTFFRALMEVDWAGQCELLGPLGAVGSPYPPPVVRGAVLVRVPRGASPGGGDGPSGGLGSGLWGRCGDQGGQGLTLAMEGPPSVR